MTRRFRYTAPNASGFKKDWQRPLADFGRKQEPVEVPCRIIRDNDRDNAILITDGSFVEEIDPKTGEITVQPKKVWIPRSHIISIEPVADGKGYIITMSEFIAKDRGLI
jgi:hypothetical protein